MASSLAAALFLLSVLQSASHNEVQGSEISMLGEVMSRMSSLEAKLQETEREMEETAKEAQVDLGQPHAPPATRHGVITALTDGQIFAAHHEQQICGQARIGNWVEDIDVRSTSATTGSFNPSTGVFTAAVNGYYYLYACFLAEKGYNCDAMIRVSNVVAVALGDRNNNNNNHDSGRETMFCQTHLLELSAGTTVDTYEDAGSNNCKRSSSMYRYGRFAGYLIEGTF